MIPTDAPELERMLNEKLVALFGIDKNLLTVARPSEGELEIAANVSDLNHAVTQLAQREAGKQGVAVEEVRLSFRELNRRSLDLEANVRAKKMFFTTTVRITGRLSIDPEFTATISNLNCAGEGAIGSMASGFLQPQLAKLNGRNFPFATLNLSGQTLRDIRVGAGDRLTVTAELAV